MIRDLFLHLLVLAGCSTGAFNWLASSGLPLWARVFVSVASGSLLLNAVVSLQEMGRRRGLIASLKNPLLRDGRTVAAVGRLVPFGRAAQAPFSNTNAVAAFYSIYTTAFRGGRSIVFEGYTIAPCVLRTTIGDLRLAACPADRLKETFLADRSAHPTPFEIADRLMAVDRSADKGDNLRRRGEDEFALASQHGRVDLVSAHRRFGPIDAQAKFLFEACLPANEELSLVGVWSGSDQVLKTDSYPPRAMRIIAWGGLGEGLKALRREMAWLAAKAMVSAAAGGLVLWVVSSSIDDIRRLIAGGA